MLSDDPRTAEPNDPTVVTVRSAPIYALSKSVSDLGGGSPQAGDRVRYTLALVNQGNSAGTNVTVRDPLPPELVDVIALDGGVVVGQQISWPSRDRLEESAQSRSPTSSKRRFGGTCSAVP